ncbi:hypothetical protein GQ54DRAFT_297875 [Martensiomyces pterosporus]|nr:hypothetical protein GQ54DRAFT_297875 [Martensiomyces pterosporus]
MSDGRKKSFAFSGWTTDGPHSSSHAELMALLHTATLVPDDLEVTVHCDSETAIATMAQIQEDSPRREFVKSPMTYLACWAVKWLSTRTVPLKLEWVKATKTSTSWQSRRTYSQTNSGRLSRAPRLDSATGCALKGNWPPNRHCH